jgi:hypothetical protein
MRAPLSEIEPIRSGVSIFTRGLWARAWPRSTKTEAPGLAAAIGLAATMAACWRASSARRCSAGRMMKNW